MGCGEERCLECGPLEKKPNSERSSRGGLRLSTSNLLPKSDNSLGRALVESGRQAATRSKAGTLQRMLEQLSNLMRGDVDSA